MDWRDHIEHRPDILFGRPVIRGTRIPVELILRKLAAGASSQEILLQHPRLTQDAVLAAQSFAADLVAGEDVVFG